MEEKKGKRRPNRGLFRGGSHAWEIFLRALRYREMPPTFRYRDFHKWPVFDLRSKKTVTVIWQGLPTPNNIKMQQWWATQPPSILAKIFTHMEGIISQRCELSDSRIYTRTHSRDSQPRHTVLITHPKMDANHQKSGHTVEKPLLSLKTC